MSFKYSEHTAERPSWDCRVCGKPWPCDPARERLASTLSLTTLAMTMWTNLEEAAGDMPTMPVSEAFERFLNWTWGASQGDRSI
jgi:hypothetical protein